MSDYLQGLAVGAVAGFVVCAFTFAALVILIGGN